MAPSNDNPLRQSSTGVLMGTATEIVDAARQNSLVLKQSATERLPRFESHEIFLGRVIGRGGFCVVNELTGIKLDEATTARGNSGRGCVNHGEEAKDSTNSTDDYDSHSCTEDVSRESFARRVAKTKKKSKKKSTRRYVVKQVSDEIKQHKNSKVEYLKGTVDLCMEAHFLANLQHPNIIKLRGSAGSETVMKDGRMFLILDCLKETFATKLKKWMQKERRTKGLTGCFTRGQKKVEQLMAERLQAAYDIADVMAFLHSKNVIYRDLKPDNIGFDTLGNLKIFDFGLAKELKVEKQDKNGLYQLTAFTGAIRYMAPEVGLKKPYNLKADVYSWSMLMWYILALEPPFPYFTLGMFTDRVFRKGTRPALRDEWPMSLKKLLKQCWQAKIEHRATFREIKDVLRSELCIKDNSHRTFESSSVEV